MAVKQFKNFATQQTLQPQADLDDTEAYRPVLHVAIARQPVQNTIDHTDLRVPAVSCV